MPPTLDAIAVADVTTTLRAERPVVRLGEPVWMRLRVTNHGDHPLEVASDPRWMGDGLVVEVTDPEGRRAPDPFHRTGHPFSGGVFVVTVPAGGAADVVFDLCAWAWLSGPGTFAVRALPRSGDRPPDDDDRRWGATTVTVTGSAAPERPGILDTVPRSLDEGLLDALLSGTTPDRPPARGESLGHPSWVPTLFALASASRPVVSLGAGAVSGSRTDERALSGLAACPCPEATAALLALLDVLPAPEHQRWLLQELTWRLPPAFAGAFPDQVRARAFASLAWDDATRAEALRRARSLLAKARPDPDRVEWATATVRAFGG